MITDKGKMLERLIHLAHANGIKVAFVPFQGNDGLIKSTANQTRIGLRADMGIDDYLFVLAHEIAHFFLHNGINVKDSCREKEYEEQANKAAKMLLQAIST